MSAFLRLALGVIRLITQGEAFLSRLVPLGAMLRSGQASLHPLGRLSFMPGEDREVAIILLRLAVPHWFHWSSFIVHVREFRPQSATVGGDERIAGLILLFGFRGITFSDAPVPLPMIAGYEVVVNYRFRSER